MTWHVSSRLQCALQTRCGTAARHNLATLPYRRKETQHQVKTWGIFLQVHGPGLVLQNELQNYAYLIPDHGRACASPLSFGSNTLIWKSLL